MSVWQPGEAIVRREVWRGHPWAAIPAIVVRDAPELLVLYIPEGAPFGFAECPLGPHPWSGFRHWHGHGVLMLQRPADAYAVFVFWRGEPRVFAQWYLNLQAPFRRTSIGIDTLDHTLDLWSADGETWHWKDEEKLAECVAQGRLTAGEAAAIHAEGARLHAELREDGRWWDDAWATWTPDPEWEVPALRDDWEREPTSAPRRRRAARDVSTRDRAGRPRPRSVRLRRRRR